MQCWWWIMLEKSNIHLHLIGLVKNPLHNSDRLCGSLTNSCSLSRPKDWFVARRWVPVGPALYRVTSLFAMRLVCWCLCTALPSKSGLNIHKKVAFIKMQERQMTSLWMGWMCACKNTFESLKSGQSHWWQQFYKYTLIIVWLLHPTNWHIAIKIAFWLQYRPATCVVTKGSRRCSFFMIYYIWGGLLSFSFVCSYWVLNVQQDQVTGSNL